MKEIKNVLSLFDGMSCGQIALNRAGIKYEKYYASEIDKYAITVTMANFPNTIQLGDIKNIKASDLPKIDLLIGGSPCQGFSFAGKQLNFEDERSKLFFEYVRLLNELKPKYFLLENVKMQKEFENVISQYMGIKPIEINSNLVSAQNRRRLYWTNIGAESSGLFGELKSIIDLPNDKGILLKNILESEVNEKYFLSEKMINYILEPNKSNRELKLASNMDKAHCSITKHDKRADAVNYLEITKPISFTIRKNIGANFTKNSKTATLMARGPGDNSGGGPYIAQKEIKQINDWNLKSNFGTQPFQQDRIYDVNGISPSLSANKSDLIIAGDFRNDEGFRPRKNGKTCALVTRGDESGKNPIIQISTPANKNDLIIAGDFRYDEGFRPRKNGKTGTLKAKDKVDVSSVQIARINTKYRRLTPIECERLQTVADNYTNHVSDSQRYKMLGNGWTVDVIVHIFSYLETN